MWHCDQRNDRFDDRWWNMAMIGFDLLQLMIMGMKCVIAYNPMNVSVILAWFCCIRVYAQKKINHVFLEWHTSERIMLKVSEMHS